MIVCDGLRHSKAEAGVFHVKGLPQRIFSKVFPFAPARLSLFLLFSSVRPGEFPGYILVINDKTDKAIYYGPLIPPPRFEPNDEVLAGLTRLKCRFPHGGRYTIQVWFYQNQGNDILKGEIPFFAEQMED